MRAVGDGRRKSPRELVLTASAGLEQREPARDGVLDAGIEANVEVEEAAFLGRTPVAAVERRLAEQIEGAGDRLRFSALARQDDVHAIAHLAADLVKEL